VFVVKCSHFYFYFFPPLSVSIVCFFIDEVRIAYWV